MWSEPGHCLPGSRLTSRRLPGRQHHARPHTPAVPDHKATPGRCPARYPARAPRGLPGKPSLPPGAPTGGRALWGRRPGAWLRPSTALLTSGVHESQGRLLRGRDHECWQRAGGAAAMTTGPSPCPPQGPPLSSPHLTTPWPSGGPVQWAGKATGLPTRGACGSREKPPPRPAAPVGSPGRRTVRGQPWAADGGLCPGSQPGVL